MTQIEIDFSDVVKQAAKLGQGDKIVDKHALAAMQSSVVTVVGAVRPLVPVGVSGQARRSISKTIQSTVRGLTGTVFSKINSIYPSVLNFGRRPGKRMPPPQALERWVRLKLGVAANKVKQVAFVVARSIGRKGFKGAFFMQKGFEKSKAAIHRFGKIAIDRITKELSIDGD